MFQQAKHISFDVWKTLIMPSKEYSKLRDECIADHFKITYEEAKAVYGNTKRFLDKSAEINENCMSSPKCWQLLEAMAKIKGTNLELLQKDTHAIFKANLPTVYPELVKQVQDLVNIYGYTVGIVSNTNFIPGQVLRESIFNEWNVFSTALFSDEELVPKPNPIIFERMYEEVQENHDDFISENDIIHVGDNKICDGVASKLGFQFFYVENPTDLSEKLKTQVVYK